MLYQTRVWKMDGTEVITTPQTIAGQLLASVPDLEYRSIVAIQSLFVELLDITMEMACIERESKKRGERGELANYLKTAEKQEQCISADRLKALTALYNYILQWLAFRS